MSPGGASVVAPARGRAVNLAGWRLFLFALIGAGAIVLLATVGTPGRREETLDRHTGERIVIVRTVADALHEARDSGHATRALETVRARRAAWPDDPVLARAEAVLAAECAPPGAPAPPDHPAAGAIEAERARSAGARAQLRGRIGERMPRESLLPLLCEIAADDAVAEATERFFGPLARWRERHRRARERCDELAARTLARLAAREGIDDPDSYLAVAEAFRAQARPRARLRWLLRAYGALPPTTPVGEALAGCYLELGHVVEALAVNGSALAAAPGDLGLWRQRATLAGWCNLPAVEAEAREMLLRERDDPGTRERIIELCAQFGAPERAVPHALALARGSSDAAVLSRPVLLALEAGDVDGAIGLLGDLARDAADPRPWKEWIVRCARQDLRVDRVVEELRELRRGWPGGPYEAELEGVYRRRRMDADLLALLEERSAAKGASAAAEAEILRLHAGLGHDEAVRALLERQVDRMASAREFLARLPELRMLGVGGLGDRTRRWVLDPSVREEEVPELLSLLEPLSDDADCAEAAGHLARRFPAHPASRDHLMRLADGAPTDDGRLLAAERLAAEFPGNPAYVRAWIERAGWAADAEQETRGREALLALDPGDDENRRGLAHLYGRANRSEEALVQWRVLAEREGLGAPSTLRLIDALFAAGRLEEAMAVLERRASLPGTTLDDRIHVADELFGNRQFDRALRFYVSALDEAPDHAHALLRTGQIRSWTNDPRGAIPYFERRLAVSDDERAEVRFYLGEAHWSILEGEAARRCHGLSLEELLPLPQRTLGQEIMVAKMLARFGRIDEARPLFESVIAQAPMEVDLLLDYADAMMTVRDTGKARELVERAKAQQPDHARVMLLDGKVALLETRYEEAATILARTIELHGPDAGIESELGRAHELAGDWSPARDAYRRSTQLQPGNHDVAFSLSRLADQLAPLVHGALDVRRAGDDSVIDGWISGSFLLDDDRTRLAGAFGVTRLSGRAAAVDAGATDVDTTAVRLRFAAFRRYERNHVLGAGVEAYPGVTGDLPIGAWAGARWIALDPYRTLGARLHLHQLLEDPPAAAGLGGRSSGALLFAQRDLFTHFWAAAELGCDLLSIDLPAGGSAGDPRLRGSATFGWRIREGQFDVADAHGIDHPEERGVLGPDLDGEPRFTRGPAVAVWVRYEAIRLLGDAELASLVPLGETFDYVTVGGRADFHLAPSFGAKVEGYAGTELHSSDAIFGLEGGLTYRPSAAIEATAILGYGRALGRSDDTDALHVRLGFTYRW